jgi:acetoin utilization deacetylase AcuC-like enzyme
MHSFYDTKEVLYFSVHQYPHYPGTGRIDEIGRGAGLGYTVNVPLYGGQNDQDYIYVFEEILVPIAQEYEPQLILVSAGFDTHRNDPLAGMGLSSDAFGRFTAVLQALAERCCPGRLALTLEGGYDPTALSEGVAAVLARLITGTSGHPEPGGDEPAEGEEAQPFRNVGSDTRQVVQEVRSVLSGHWKSLPKR